MTRVRLSLPPVHGLGGSLRLAVLCLALAPLAGAENLSDALNNSYKNHILGVRNPIHEGDQEFDSSANPLNPRPAKDWEVYGGVLIEKLTVTKDQLRIEALRVAPSNREEHGKPAVIPLAKKTNFEIRLDHPLGSIDEARAVLGRVFYLDEIDAEHRKPELRRAGANAPNPVALKDVTHTPGFVLPKPQYTPAPDFSEAARRRRFQGTVLLSVLLDPQGAVAAVKIDQGLGYGLDESALETVKRWRFTPATRNGAPLSLWMPIEVEFHLYGH